MVCTFGQFVYLIFCFNNSLLFVCFVFYICMLLEFKTYFSPRYNHIIYIFFVLFCFVLFCFVLFCFVLFCFALFCFV